MPKVSVRELWLGSVTIPPGGGRTKAHVHENHESTCYLVGGDVELCTGDELEPAAGSRTPAEREWCSPWLIANYPPVSTSVK